MPGMPALMPTLLNAEHWYKLRWFLLIPALFMFHYGLVSALLALGSEADITTQDNPWLSLADTLSVANPELEAALARYDISRGLITVDEHKIPRFESALAHWDQAAKLRPYWPYYLLGGLDASIRLNQPADEIQRRFSEIVQLAPKECGIDRTLLMLSVFSWEKLTPEQHNWVLERMQTANYSTRRYVFDVSKGTPGRLALCVNLPWKIGKQFCR